MVEQNPAGATYGWGVVFSDRALGFLAEADPESYADLAPRLETWGDQAIVHRGETVRIDGLGFSGIARLTLLGVLQAHCRRRGVALELGTRCADPAALADADLLVGADGAGSVVRERYRARFEPRGGDALEPVYLVRDRSALRLPHADLQGSRRRRLRRAPLSSRARRQHLRGGVRRRAPGSARASPAMSEEATRRYCEGVFAPELGGHPLLSNRSAWLSFRNVTCRRWQGERRGAAGRRAPHRALLHRLGHPHRARGRHRAGARARRGGRGALRARRFPGRSPPSRPRAGPRRSGSSRWRGRAGSGTSASATLCRSILCPSRMPISPAEAALPRSGCATARPASPPRSRPIGRPHRAGPQ